MQRWQSPIHNCTNLCLIKWVLIRYQFLQKWLAHFFGSIQELSGLNTFNPYLNLRVQSLLKSSNWGIKTCKHSLEGKIYIFRGNVYPWNIYPWNIYPWNYELWWSKYYLCLSSSCSILLWQLLQLQLKQNSPLAKQSQYN